MKLYESLTFLYIGNLSEDILVDNIIRPSSLLQGHKLSYPEGWEQARIVVLLSDVGGELPYCRYTYKESKQSRLQNKE